MSTALAVRHGPFGRAALYKLNRVLPDARASRRASDLLDVAAGRRCITVSGEPLPLDFGTRSPSIHGSRTVSSPAISTIGRWRSSSTSDPTGSAATAGRATGIEFGRPTLDDDAAVSIGWSTRVVAQLVGEDGSNGFDRHLFDLACACQEQTWSSGAERDRRSTADALYRDFRIRNSIRLMQERIGDELAIDTIARDAGLSRPHFYKLFRQHVGITPNIYLNTLRMESAIDRLTRTTDPVTAIGLDLGFASQASFTRFFTTNVGVPPERLPAGRFRSN